MTEARSGRTRHSDIVERGVEVFGPSADALVRELSRRLPLARRDAFLELVEAWPAGADGRPRDPDLLFARLVELLESLEPAARAPERSRRRRRRRRTSPRGGVLGAAVGGLIGLPLGVLAYLIARETLFPPYLWTSDEAMWAVILGVAVPAGLIGLAQGAVPTRLGHALLVGLVAFLLGGLGSATLAGLLAFAYAAVTEAPELETESDVVVELAFALVPLAAVMGGATLGLWLGYRAWRRWSTWSEARAR